MLENLSLHNLYYLSHFLIMCVLLCRYFERQLEIAEESKLPMFLHCRNSTTDFLDILTRNRERFTSGVVRITIILLKSLCCCSQTAGCNSCSIVSGDVSNCSYRLTVHPVTSLRLSSAYPFLLYAKTPKNYREY